MTQAKIYSILMIISFIWNFILIHHKQQYTMMSDTIIRHFPVMGSNLMKKMQTFPSILPLKIADCNFGLGGHSKLLLNRFPKAFIQAFDLDPSVINYFKEHYSCDLNEEQLKRLTVTNNNFSSIAETKIYDKFDTIIADFGFCSYHLQTERGFSWLKDQDLDMRYSSQGRTCSEIINQSSQLELMAILQRYGQLKGSKNIAELIIASRPIKTTAQLRDIVVKCVQDDKTRKIAQTFQAFRIATNNQLKDIEKLCNSLQKCLVKGGLFIGITFHSLERDVIHKVVRQNSKMFSKVQIESPSDEQIKVNPKSKSAKMLSFRKLI